MTWLIMNLKWVTYFTQYSSELLFYTPSKHQKTFRFSDVFRGYRKATPGCNGLFRDSTSYYFKLRCRLVFSRFFDTRGYLGNVKDKSTRKLVSPVKWNDWLYAYTLQNFATRHFFNVNGVSIVISWERDVETGENIWKVLKTKVWA